MLEFLLPFVQPRSSRSNLSLPPSLATEPQRSGTPHSFCGDEFEGRPSTPTPQQCQQSRSPPPSVSGVTASGDREMPSSRSCSPLTTSTQQLHHTQDMRRSKKKTPTSQDGSCHSWSSPTPNHTCQRLKLINVIILH